MLVTPNFNFTTKILKILGKYGYFILGTFDLTVFILSQCSQHSTLLLVCVCFFVCDKCIRSSNFCTW